MMQFGTWVFSRVILRNKVISCSKDLDKTCRDCLRTEPESEVSYHLFCTIKLGAFVEILLGFSARCLLRS